MVQIIVFVPSPDNLQWVESMARELETSEARIDVVHHFGTPEVLRQLEGYDVIVARGITYRKLCDLYPGKHITHLDFDGADILEALLHCRDRFHPSKIGLCLNREGLQDVLPGLEAACGASIRLYDVVDEASAFPLWKPPWQTGWRRWSAPAPSAISAGNGGFPVPISAPGPRRCAG